MAGDEGVRSACFLALAVLQAQYGEELPYIGALDKGFAFRGARVPFLNRQKGIYRAAVQTGPAALSIQTSYRSPYADVQTELGFFYDYRAGRIDQADNRALREAHRLAVPIAYFVGTRPGWYRPLYPCYVVDDDPVERRALVSLGKLIGPVDDPEPVPVVDPFERRYVTREVKVRLHQARFRGIVLPAYRDQCAICRLREVRLLDAAHIIVDLEPTGAPIIPNGLSLCTIHHRAYDQDLVGVAPDFKVHVARRLREDEDGPMLDVLKDAEGRSIVLPSRKVWQPDQDRLAVRYERFLSRD